MYPFNYQILKDLYASYRKTKDLEVGQAALTHLLFRADLALLPLYRVAQGNHATIFKLLSALV